MKDLPFGIFAVVMTISFFVMMFLVIKDPTIISENDKISIIHVPKEETKEKRDFLISTTIYSLSSEGLIIKGYINHREGKSGEFIKTELVRIEESHKFAGLIPGLEKGKRTYYYIEATDVADHTLRLPKTEYLVLRWIGDTPRFLLYSHIFFMAVALVFLIHALYYALYQLILEKRNELLYKSVFWGTVCFFIAGFPIGWWVAYIAYGIAWTGVPFGWDITDNKTLITFFYWATIMVLLKGNPFRLVDSKRYIISDRTFSVLTIIGAIITLVVFLIPHSI